MSQLVLDASAGVEFLLDTDAGRAIEAALPPRGHFWVPEHYFLDVSATVRTMELHRGLPVPRATRAIQRVATDIIHRVRLQRLIRTAWERRGHLTVADALYVVLAEQLDATLVTADKRLANAPGLRVPTITP